MVRGHVTDLLLYVLLNNSLFIGVAKAQKPSITREVSSLEFIGVCYVWCELNFWIPGFTHSSAWIPN